MLREEHLQVMAVKSDPSCFREIRRWIRQGAANAGFGIQASRDLAMAANEACANIHRHAYQGRCDGRIDLEMEIGEDRFQLRIRDYGVRFDTAGYRPPDLRRPSEGGYGLYLMKALTDRVVISSRGAGTEVIMEKFRPGRRPRKAG